MPFKHGKSGNPGGRPKGFAGLALYVREQTNQGKDLVDIALQIAKGELKIPTPVGKDAVMMDLPPTAKERMTAVSWLADRGFGKPLEIPIDDKKDGDPLDGLSTGELKELAKLDAPTEH